MKTLFTAALCFMLLAMLGSCTAIAGIFKAGAVVGIIAVVIAIAIIIWIISLFRRKGNQN